MVMRLLIFLSFFGFTIFSSEATTGLPVANKGIMDLRSLEKDKNFIINLNGEWEFYWNKMLRPNDFENNSFLPDCFGKIPSYWTDYQKLSVKTEKFGYATYRLTVLLPPGFEKSLGVDMPVFDSSYDIYINGEYYGGNGVPGKTAEESEPEYRRNFFRLRTGKDTLSIIINVANFDHRRGGFWLPVRLGTFSEVQRKLANSWAWQWSIISLLLGFSGFFLLFYVISKRDKETLFFSIATICLAVRPLFTSHYLVSNLIDLPWVWIIRFEYLGLFILLISWVWFMSSIYPTKLIKIFAMIVSVIFSLIAVLTLFMPVKIFSYATQIYYPVMFILIAYPLIMSFRGLLKKNIIDIFYFIAFFLIVFGGIHDIQVASGKVESSTGYILTYFILLFVCIQAGLMMYKWIKAFNEKEKLQGELEFMNRNLEILVNERTQEIIARNKEIEKQSAMITLQNNKLSETIHIKNRIFSVIAHDLRSPVVNILYMLNLLKEKEYKEKYDTFANSSIEYAQMVINLLENMLVWGREQEDKIKYSPERQDLADLILTNLSIFKETADKKNILVNFTQVGSTVAYFDKDLLDIVIRNILSNAVKYTHRGGRISILLKDKTSSNEGVMLKICDNGVGIPENKQKNFFASSEIESTPGTENEKGTGLGLILCYDLVKLNKGTIAVESAPGEGTCFMITLPG
ncbi:MAG: sensor histidine kinase [Bacteroidetes bacterium]|nr:sensor histidine kinase [Bacteroidota bacterium]